MDLWLYVFLVFVAGLAMLLVLRRWIWRIEIVVEDDRGNKRGCRVW